jgi:hypothetical protein
LHLKAANDRFPLLDYDESKSLEERLRCSAHVGGKFCDVQPQSLAVNEHHQGFAYALTRIMARDEEMVDVSVLLDIGVTNRLTINFSDASSP